MKKITMSTLLSLTMASSSFAGYQFTSKTTDAQGQQLSGTKGWVDGPKVRIEQTENSSDQQGEAGSYLLSNDGGKTVYMVSPRDKSYMKIDVDQLATRVGTFMNAAGPLMKVEFKDPQFKTVLNERGPEMFGLSTRHIKTTTSYTVDATVFGHHNITQVSRKDEIWLTKELNDSGMEIWSQQREIKTGNENIDKVIAAESKRLGGIPLKVISVTTSKSSDGEEETETSITEITSLKKADIPADTFKVPAGYQNKTEKIKSGLQALTSGLQKMQQSSNGGSDSKASCSGNEAEDAGKAIGGLLNGLFGGGK